ncbi:septal ring lytic transglycosylase RlpA family protein [Methylobrevis pamukkalensis]|uniref:Endolytic peptidoglycan transglycosylase RlpA n=1 Tax=Methylobrevis pamukkalensis TaxID=1439726 RepID=A0A1E3GX58_9HYPH|nr:septal ring lytic transglycosylase RlpA family protein [Methylobrevis pamukkalensis]ODN68584.1 RlpA-like protein precursor [Methylobrevis pamukkalensis]
MTQITHRAPAATLLLLALGLAACGSGPRQCGKASWYELTSRTASGEYANPEAMTAAHRSLPFGTKVEVQNLRNGRTAVVRINDRGPYGGGRVIDVTRAAADRLGFRRDGIAPVRIRALSGGELRGGSC